MLLEYDISYKEYLSSVFGCDWKGWHLTTQFCKRSSNGFEPKQAKNLTIDELEAFWADEKESETNLGLLQKVISCSCHFAGDRSKEVISLLYSDVHVDLQKKEVKFCTQRSKGEKLSQWHLIISDNGCDKASLFQLYITKVRESVACFEGDHCFYLQVEAKTGCFKAQHVGKNYISEIFKYIAAYHGKDPAAYTSHGGRAGSISTMVDNGAPLPLIMDHANLRSEHVYKRYVRNSDKRQREIAEYLVPRKESGTVPKPLEMTSAESPAKKRKVVFKNCTFTNCKVSDISCHESEEN